MLDVMILVMHDRLLMTGILVMICRLYPEITFAEMEMARWLGCRYTYDDICIGFHGDYTIHFISSGETRFLDNILSKHASYIDIYMRYQGSVLWPKKNIFTSETFDPCSYVKSSDIHVVMSKFWISMNFGKTLIFTHIKDDRKESQMPFCSTSRYTSVSCSYNYYKYNMELNNTLNDH